MLKVLSEVRNHVMTQITSFDFGMQLENFPFVHTFYFHGGLIFCKAVSSLILLACFCVSLSLSVSICLFMVGNTWNREIMASALV